MPLGPAAKRTVKLRGVIFDLDGTLLDTLEDIATALNRVLEERGVPTHPLESYRHFVGEGARRLVEKALPGQGRGGAEVDEVLAAFSLRYHRDLIVSTRLYPGVATLLDRLESEGIGAAIVSNKPDALTQRLVSELLHKWSFAFVTGAIDGIAPKPDPTQTLGAARALGLTPATCAFVGDSDLDMETAHAAGMVPFGAPWGFRGAPELEKAGAEVILPHPLGLLDHLE